jgi:hypothetical protein
LDRGSHLPKAVLIASLVFAQGGCGLFDTREPVKPQGPVVPCLITSSPDNVVENIRVHYGQPSVVSCYTPMLDSLFLFHPDQVDSTTTPESFLTPWNRAVEERVAANIAADSVQTFVVVFDSTYQNSVIDTGPPQRETRFYQYHLLFTKEGRFAPKRFQGRMEITFEQKAGTGLWRILSWIDHADGSIYPTWGRLRADHRTGI